MNINKLEYCGHFRSDNTLQLRQRWVHWRHWTGNETVTTSR